MTHRIRSGQPAFALLTVLPIVVATLLGARPASASCTTCTPATPAPRELWGALEPVDAVGVRLPAQRDSTTYTGAAGQFPDSSLPLFSSLDIEAGYAFVSYSSGFEVWNLANPPAISRVGVIDGWKGEFLRWPGFSENRWLIWDIDAPPGNSDLVATAGFVGLAIWDTRDKSRPVHAYQDGVGASGELKKVANAVWAGTLANGRSYAFLASSQNVSGLYAYDMTKALDYLPNGCSEDASVTIGCPGVYQGRVGNSIAYWVDGISVGGRTFVAFGSGFASGDVQIWDVSTPSAPSQVVGFAGGSWPHAAAFWQDGASTYLGVRTISEARIYDVTACVDGNGCSAGEIVQKWSQALSGSAAHYFVTFSRSGGTPFLYFGSDNKNSGGLQREFLFDVSNPAAPVEVSPKTTAVLGGDTVDYWGYYYSGNATGFNQVMPRVAKFDGTNFYRAAWTIFDIHRLVDVAPSIVVSGPATGYRGGSLGFTATAQNCVPDAAGWSWTATPDGAGSSTSSTVNLTWPTTGLKTVTATNTACGIAEGSTTVTILDPAPAVASVTASPSPASVCTPVTFTANGVTGQPTLTFGWTVKDGGGATVGTGSTNPFAWDTTALSGITSPTTYTGTVTVSGPGGPDATASRAVTLNPLVPLADISALEPAGVVNFNQVSFTAPTSPPGDGATEWEWNFGDGAVQTYTDPAVGPNPTHIYLAVGSYPVTVTIRNCADQTGSTSLAATIVIDNTAPLNASFAAQGCSPFVSVCSFTRNTAITFDDSSSPAGAIDTWYYDWNNTSPSGPCTNFDAGHAAPVTTHAYATTGNYYPCLRVEGSGVPDESIHAKKIVITDGVPAAITVSGPATGTVNQSATFSASASGCSPAANGWSWSTGGGTGSSTTSSISVTWSTTGSKTVTATNSACGSASGSRSITISDGGGSGVAANFTFSPASPAAGQAVSFNGSSSTGAIVSYSWNFGDGALGSGVTASHTFAAAGAYSVTLTVRPSGCVSPGCSASDTKTVTVTGGSGGLAAHFTFTPTSPAAGESVAFDASASTGDIGTYSWNFGDGTTATGVIASHAYASAGSYNVALTVRPPGCVAPGCSNSLTQTVTVTGGTPLVANFDFAPASPTVGQAVGFDASASTGQIATYSWDFGDGDTGTGMTADHTYSTPGSYDVVLTIRPPGCVAPGCAKSTTRLVEVADVLLGCAADSETLCLQGGRFAVAVHFRDQVSGDTGVGRVMPFPSTDQSGAFFFFNPTNPELLVKVLDGTSLPGNAFWVFYGSLTNVEFWLDVTDTQGDADPDNDVVKEYHNLQGPIICGVLDTEAFPQGAPAPVTGGGPATAMSVLHGIPLGARGESAIAGAVSGTCVPSDTHLCLLDGRFSIEASFVVDAQPGEAQAVAGNDQSGYFWFFNAENLELVVKMVDATGPFGYFWVFWGGTTNVEYTLRVTDTVSSDTWEATNPQGSYCGGSDTAAFPAP